MIGPADLPPPVVVHAAGERHLVQAAYVRDVADWRQFWLYYAYNDQDRGVLRTGRHEGDWELVQVRHDGSEAVFAQHSGAERCPWSPRRRLIVHAARGSHASYFVPGVRDRGWPDPNDEHPGDGRRVTPPVRSDLAPLQVRRRWGGSRAGWFPGEASSPLSPAFQRPWRDPDGFAADARACERERCDAVGECDGRESLGLGFGLGLAALLGVAFSRRRRRRASGMAG